MRPVKSAGDLASRRSPSAPACCHFATFPCPESGYCAATGMLGLASPRRELVLDDWSIAEQRAPGAASNAASGQGDRPHYSSTELRTDSGMVAGEMNFT